MDEARLFPLLLSGWYALSGISFVALLFVSAPYGRHERPGWGPTVNATTGWVLMELPAVLVFALFFLLGDRRTGPAVAFLVLWEIHYVHRALVFPFRRRASGKRMPLTIVLLAVLFNVANGYLNGRYLFTLGPRLPGSWLLGPIFLLGAALFAAGMAVNLHSDSILFRLRDAGGNDYRIPQGGLFRLVSCPNYMGEIVEWAGWAIATWSPAGLAFAVWTAANLAPRALTHHRWYRKQFPEYPPGRRALIPFLL